MKKIVQGIVLAALFAVTLPIKGNKDYFEGNFDKENIQNVATGAGIIAAGTLGLHLMTNWLNKPTSKNLFSIASLIQTNLDYVKKISDNNNKNKKTINPEALRNIENLISNIYSIIKDTSEYNKIFKNLTQKSIVESIQKKESNHNQKNNLISINNEDANQENNLIRITHNNNIISVQINTTTLDFIISEIQKAAKAEASKEKSTFWSRIWNKKR